MILPHVAIVLAVAVAAPPLDAGRGERCPGVAIEYDIARAEVRDAAQTYQKCLASERSPCADEFAELDLAQDRFEHASEQKRACGR